MRVKCCALGCAARFLVVVVLVEDMCGVVYDGRVCCMVKVLIPYF